MVIAIIAITTISSTSVNPFFFIKNPLVFIDIIIILCYNSVRNGGDTMRKLIFVLCLLILITLVGCSKEPSNSSEPISSSGVSTTTQSETDSFPSSESSNTPSTDITESSNQEIGSDTTSSISNPAHTNSSSKTNINRAEYCA